MSVREELQAILDENGDLTPALVVDAARDEDHPLHDRFDWDDSDAAEKWRINQAAHLIRSVKVTREIAPDRVIHVRAFIARHELGAEDESPVGSYLPVQQVMESDILTSAWFRQLEREWKALKRRAGDCKEFADMVLDDVRAASA